MHKFMYEINLYSTLEEMNLLLFLDLESGNDWWKEEDVYMNQINRSNVSKLLLKIKNLWSIEWRRCLRKWDKPIKCFQTPFEDWKALIGGDKGILGFENEKIEKMDRKNYLNLSIHDENTSSDVL